MKSCLKSLFKKVEPHLGRSFVAKMCTTVLQFGPSY